MNIIVYTFNINFILIYDVIVLLLLFNHTTSNSFCVIFNHSFMSSFSTICSDKTGTLTQNRMTLVKAYLDGADETEDIEAFLKGIIEYGHEVLAQTPEMLPVLKQAGVVDAGGRGLLYILEIKHGIGSHPEPLRHLMFEIETH